MIKSKELATPSSCINQAADDEPVFVLRGKDICAADIVRDWCIARIRAGKNKHDDEQIREAQALADQMEEYAAAHKARTGAT